MKLQRIESAEWVGDIVFRLAFGDETSGVGDLGSELTGGSYAAATIAASPQAFQVAARGRALVWLDADGDEVDIDAETLHAICQTRRVAAE